MQTMHRVVLGLGFVIAASVMVVPVAQAATRLTLKLTSYTTITQVHETPPKGKPHKGDSIDFKDLLVTTADQLGKPKGKPVGYDAGVVVYTSATAQQIGGVTTFPGFGTLTFKGELETLKDGSAHVPVVSGSGAFKGARGMLIIGAGDQKAPNTYVLTLPRPLAPPGSA